MPDQTPDHSQGGPEEDREVVLRTPEEKSDFLTQGIDPAKIGPREGQLTEEQEDQYWRDMHRAADERKNYTTVDPIIEGEAVARDLDPDFDLMVRTSEARIAEAMARREKDLAQLRYFRRHPRKARLRRLLHLKPGEYTEPIPQVPAR